jgi:hypothetical protein
VTSELDWTSILEPFPVGRREAIRVEIEVARNAFLADEQRGSNEQRELWQRIAVLLNSAAVTELRQLVPRIDFNNLPDPGFIGPHSPPHEWLLRLSESLTKGGPVAAAYADLCKPRERFYSRLLRTWTGAGFKLSVSATGPLVRFVQDATNDLFPEQLTGDAIKEIVRREWERRRIGAAPATFEGQGGLSADADVVKAKK